MARRRQSLASFVAFILLLGAVASAQAQADVPALIASLGDRDPAVREQVFESLAAMGPAIRPQLLQAQRAENPEIRARASALLLKLPWPQTSDPPYVRRVLEKYGELSVHRRLAAVRQLAGLAADAGWPALARLLTTDPSDEVGWTIVGLLRERGADPPHLELAPQKMSSMSAPLAALAGRAHLRREPKLSADLFRRAIDLDALHPAGIRTEVLLVAEDLERLYRRAGLHDAAADLLRRQIPLCHTMAERDDITRRLLALHAETGPLRGFVQDLQVCRPDFSDPLSLYSLAHLLRREELAPLAAAAERLARGAGGIVPVDHIAVGDFLLDRDWLDPADEEFKAASRLSAADDVPDRANAEFRLADVSHRRRDLFNAAEHLRAALDVIERHPSSALHLSANPLQHLAASDLDSMRARMHWLYFLDARRRGDAKLMQQHATALVALAPTSDALTLDLFPELTRWERNADALVLFERAYADLKSRQKRLADDPSGMNRLAWLCARCGGHLDEALSLAKRAVAAEPKNPAFLDTLAEANFALGHSAEAVRIEKWALQLAPDDPSILAQLARFESGHWAPATEPAATNPAGPS